MILLRNIGRWLSANWFNLSSLSLFFAVVVRFWTQP
jgi:hypothetical protein